jgi:glucose-1-phosphate thymidylyltransferase
LGIDISYAIQSSPAGLPQAFVIGENFIGNDSCAMILGDNIFYGTDLAPKLQAAAGRNDGATIFAYAVRNPGRYGVVELDKQNKVLSLEEKPDKPRSRYAVTGLYFYDSNVVSIAKSLRPSERGELEITDLNKVYLGENRLQAQLLGRGTAWFDTGTQRSLLAAANFVETIEERQGLKICCPEEIAYHMGYISDSELERIAAPLTKSGYGKYLLDILREGEH